MHSNDTNNDINITMLASIGPDLLMREGVFRFQNQKCILSYDGHLDKDEYIRWLVKKTRVNNIAARDKAIKKHKNPEEVRKIDRGIKYIYVAHDSTGVPMTHILVDLGYSFFIGNSNTDYLDYHGNCVRIITLLDRKGCWSKALLYMYSLDIECYGLQYLLHVSKINKINASWQITFAQVVGDQSQLV